eukprot:CAMPEP_0194207244 /NCGR_PEP_ID=MMETSP0156-20130528/6041_1 /TAXON_ID=33649 /ORGANISM="Thalassionema nitzschioides, Strain L26-B" /LENGTH=209 /DNA_ID=CAMNT_0038933957 /DNA_START=20 /DNA_END=649 /DNA_ORIENTATION=-
MSLLALNRSHAYTGYLSYTNAKCTSGGGISGTLLLSYDDDELNEYCGYSMAWDSMCLSYEGGSYRFDDSDDDITWPEYEWDATCVTCNGITGCSSDGTCENFLTYAGDESSNSYQLSSSSSSSSSKKEISANALGFTQNAKDSVVQEADRLSSEESASSGGMMAFAGGAAAAFVAFAVVGALLGRRQWKGEEVDGVVEMAYHRDSSVAV